MVKTVRITVDIELMPLADMITLTIRRGQDIRLEAPESDAVYLSVQAIALARSYLAYDGIEIGFISGFIEAGHGCEMDPAMYLHVDRPERLLALSPKEGLAAPCTREPGDD